MYWQEDDQRREFRVPDDIQDLAFRINCPRLPLEHAEALSAALQQALPWLAEEPCAGIHLIHGAESGNGWMRPEDPATEVLHLPRRARMTLRLPKERLEEAHALTGKTLDVGGYRLEVGEALVKPLSVAPTLFARYVVDLDDAGEEAFVEVVAAEIRALGIKVRKLMCGRVHRLGTAAGAVVTRSIMVADLDKRDSVLLQQRGIGPHRQQGCGLFLPHKSIAPVVDADR